jgi:serine/threonine protein kinase
MDDDLPDGPFTNDPLEKLFDKNRPDDIDAHEAKVIITLIRRILQYEPSQRPSAAQLLEDLWFKD